jgi:hypothetical protein
MSQHPTYEAARIVAPIAEAHFADHHFDARERGEEDLAPEPDANTIQTIVDATFWASFRREEGQFPKISLAFVSPEQVTQPLLFEKRFSLVTSVLTKLAPAVERPGVHLGVWHGQERLEIWGATRSLPSLCFVIEVVEPGLLVIKHRRIDGFGKFANVAILKGEQIKRFPACSAAAHRRMATVDRTSVAVFCFSSVQRIGRVAQSGQPGHR